MTSTTTEIRYQRKADLITADMDGDIVMMSIERGEYYGIGGVGSRVWALLEQAISVQNIVTTICNEYEVTQAQCQQDIQAFVAELVQKGLVEPV